MLPQFKYYAGVCMEGLSRNTKDFSENVASVRVDILLHMSRIRCRNSDSSSKVVYLWVPNLKPRKFDRFSQNDEM